LKIRKLTKKEKKKARYWTKKWPQAPIIYHAQYGRPRDVRTFIFRHSHILENAIEKRGLIGKNDDETMHKILMFVIDYLKYTGDKETKGQAEFWQNPEDTLTLGRGDCEDGAILIKSFSLVAGIPDYKIKICAGSVKGGGHAYCIYLRDDNTWCILDWCYWPNKLPINKRKNWANEKNYYDIWFTFNERFAFASGPKSYGE
jgi:predicted transglutaminase-like cysteine proteinase